MLEKDNILTFCGWAGLLIFVAFCIGLFDHKKDEEKVLREASAKVEQEVSVLPPGIEEAWVNYIRKRLAEDIQREGDNIKVRHSDYYGDTPQYAYVSLNYPYKIECNDDFNMGLSVQFGIDEESSITANIMGSFSSDHKNEPSRNVSMDSIASRNLDLKLCQLTANWLSTVINKNHASKDL